MASLAIPALDTVLATTFGVSVASQLVVFYGALYHSQLTTEKQRSWVLSTYTSAIMTLGSLPFLYAWATTRDVSNVLTRPAELGCTFFMSYLLCDLVIGSIHYRSSISLLTGWIHHTVYLVLLSAIIIPRGFSSLFCMACILEFPTFLLAIGSLDARLRNDYLFAGVFFLTRIVFHIYLATSLARRAMSPAGGSWIPSVTLAAVLPMHIMWMRDCIAGIIRRRARRIAMVKEGVPTQAVPVTPLNVPLSSVLLPTGYAIATAVSAEPKHDSRFLTPRMSVRTRAAMRAQDIYARIRDPNARAALTIEGAAAIRRLRDRLRRSRTRFVL